MTTFWRKSQLSSGDWAAAPLSCEWVTSRLLLGLEAVWLPHHLGEMALISCADRQGDESFYRTPAKIPPPAPCSTLAALLGLGLVLLDVPWLCWGTRGISGSQSRKTLLPKNSNSRDRSNIQPRINNQGEALPGRLHKPEQFRGSLMFSSSAKCL